jgi:hypothetical protein
MLRKASKQLQVVKTVCEAPSDSSAWVQSARYTGALVSDRAIAFMDL